VVLGGETASVPLVAFVPVQPPPAWHELALVEDQVAIEMLPAVMLVGLAESAAVGAATLPPPPLFGPDRPPAPESATFTFATTIYWFDHN
jgi:hypothetical protein